MTMLQDLEAVKEALWSADDYIARVNGDDRGSVPWLSAALSRLTALIEQVKGQEPVAWIVYAKNGNVVLWSRDQMQATACAAERELDVTPLYAHPAPTVDVDGLLNAAVDFEVFLNTPPDYEDQRKEREFRHDAYREWEKVRAALRMHLEKKA